jgi:hypothetical protein
LLPFDPETPETAYEEFKGFCDLAYNPGQRVYFFIAWPDSRTSGERHGPDPDPRRQALPRHLHRKELWYRDKSGVRQEITVHAGISVKVNGRLFRHTFDKLSDFNRLGFEIFCCPSTLTNNWRAGYSVYASRWVIVESDCQSITDQLAWAAKHPEVRFAVYTGGKSAHCWVEIPEVFNPDYLWRWEDIGDARNANLKVGSQWYSSHAAKVGEWAAAGGVIYDSGVLNDPSRMVRVPGFRHRKGNLARLATPTVLSRVATRDNLSSSSPPSMPLDFRSDIPTAISASPALLKPTVSGPKPVVGHGQWLLDLRQWEMLVRGGITARHTRNVLHHALFTVARMRGWTEDEIARWWERVVNIHPANIGCAVSEAVADVIRHWRADKISGTNPAFVLPRMQNLPVVVAGHRQQSLQERLAQMGCADPYSVRRICCDVLWPLAVNNPKACLEGHSISSKRMKAVSRRGDSRIARRWLAGQGVLRVVSHSYQVGRFFKRYRISVHLMIWLLGYKVDDLEWQWEADVRVSPADRKAALGKDNDAEVLAVEPWLADLAPTAGGEIDDEGFADPAPVAAVRASG